MEQRIDETRAEWVRKTLKGCFQRDNVCLLVSRRQLNSRNTSLGLLPSPLYSRDVAFTNYCLFGWMQRHIFEERFSSYAEIPNWLDEFFGSKQWDFLHYEICFLPDSWANVETSDGNTVNKFPFHFWKKQVFIWFNLG